MAHNNGAKIVSELTVSLPSTSCFRSKASPLDQAQSIVGSGTALCALVRAFPRSLAGDDQQASGFCMPHVVRKMPGRPFLGLPAHEKQASCCSNRPHYHSESTINAKTIVSASGIASRSPQGDVKEAPHVCATRSFFLAAEVLGLWNDCEKLSSCCKSCWKGLCLDPAGGIAVSLREGSRGGQLGAGQPGSQSI